MHAVANEIRITAALAPRRTLSTMDSSKLLREIESYLAAVALYRKLGCEPKWRPE